MYYMGFTYDEAIALPLWQRRWFIERLNKEFAKAKESGGGGSRAAHDNTPDVRALQGLTRATVPSRLRRFT